MPPATPLIAADRPRLRQALVETAGHIRTLGDGLAALYAEAPNAEADAWIAKALDYLGIAVCQLGQIVIAERHVAHLPAEVA